MRGFPDYGLFQVNSAAITRRLLSMIYPPNIYCMRCGDTIDASRMHGLCDECSKCIPWAANNPFRSYMDEFAFDDVWPVTRYGSHVRGMIHSLKLYGKTYMARNMGRLMAERVLMEHTAYDGLVAVPLYKDKESKRGYNQAALLAEYTAKELEATYWKNALLKLRETGSMRMADGTARRNMLSEAVGVAPEYKVKIKNAHLLLVDDVCTTGSTADACARVLKEAGACKVTLLCFAASAGYRQFEGTEEDNEQDKEEDRIDKEKNIG